MALPCPKCGGTKTESVRASLLYWLAEAFGYRLRTCGRCRSYRLFKRGASRGSHSPQHGAEETSQPDPAPQETATATAPQPAVDTGGSSPPQEEPRQGGRHACPRCGSKDYRRSHRSWWERRRGSPPM